ncbi:hypothetical protein BJ875DRAFT_128736 [Amylocarpus encephaloides]|uniref:Peptidase M14 domain-containing protein n=1 Tax=Amylocarpus encephaloides TaxID=45428 RepID=A0A9P7YC38_9HELO|nr:hypothetical protein BJ875DRAFT_128736 [Amylocarpus encephaloides]
MRSQLASLGYALTAIAGVVAEVSYDGAKAIRIPVGEDVFPVMDIIRKLDLATWKGVSAAGIPTANSNVDVVVTADKIAQFDELAKDMTLDVLHEDLGASILAEGRQSRNVAATAVDLSWFNSYHEYADHVTYLKELQAQYPDNSEIVVAGNSWAGRPITGIHFWGTAKGKPAVVLHSTVHAREWITTMTTEYLAYTLLSGYSSSAEIKGFVDKYDYYVFPVVNPDGFVYTQTNDRLWRKNRQTISTNRCVGRDINRNWPFKWEVTGGASTDPCSETYKGQSAGDAPENIILRNYLNNIAATQKLQLYIDVHSYSQLFMTPYGYSCSALATNNAEFQSLAKGVSAAIRAVYGTAYQYGPICTTIYQATGSAVDYANDISKAKYPFTIELRDTGRYGFILPPSQILPTVVETYAGFKYLLQNMIL